MLRECRDFRYIREVKNPRPICPSDTCRNHHKPPADFYRKKGYRRPKHNHKPVPIYQCKECGSYFSATQGKPIRQQKKPDLNQQIFRLAASGVSMRRMERLLECSKRTIARKIVYLADQARAHHVKRLAEVQTSFVMMDELETFIHARWRQVSVPVIVRPKTGEILAFGVARTPSNMKQGIQFNRWVNDDRPQVIPAVLSTVSGCLKPGATLSSDGASSYPKWMARYLPGVKHTKLKSPNTPGYDPLFAINVLFAKMRNDLARLGRKTWTTTKTINGLENHLWLYVAWVNRYPLK